MKTWIQSYQLPKFKTDTEPNEYFLSVKATGTQEEIKEITKKIKKCLESRCEKAPKTPTDGPCNIEDCPVCGSNYSGNI